MEGKGTNVLVYVDSVSVTVVVDVPVVIVATDGKEE